MNSTMNYLCLFFLALLVVASNHHGWLISLSLTFFVLIICFEHVTFLALNHLVFYHGFLHNSGKSDNETKTKSQWHHIIISKVVLVVTVGKSG